MPFRIEQQAGVVRLTLSGTITANDLREISSAAGALEDELAESPPRLTDLTAVDTIDLTFTDVLALANARRSRTFPSPFKSAILIGNDVQMGYARMFQTLNDHPMVTIELFTDRELAEHWLQAPGSDEPRPR